MEALPANRLCGKMFTNGYNYDFFVNPINHKVHVFLCKKQVAALNPEINFDSSMVEKLFLGDHISYIVGECRLVRT